MCNDIDTIVVPVTQSSWIKGEKASKLVSKTSGGRARGNFQSLLTRTSPRKFGNAHETLSKIPQGDYNSNTCVKQLFSFIIIT